MYRFKRLKFFINTLVVVAVVCSLLASRQNRRTLLCDTKFGVNHHLTQEREPTELEIREGLDALKRWKSSESERSHLADRLILGKTLIGMKVTEVIEQLGSPGGGYANSEYIPGKTKCFGYGLPLEGYSVNELIVELDDNQKIEKAYIDINY